MPEIICGRNPILEALKAARPLNRVLIDAHIPRHGVITEIIGLAHSLGVPVEYVEQRALDKFGPGSQGIAAFTAAKEYVDLEDLLKISADRNEPPFYVVLDGIEDPQNFGAILRTADAAGVHGVIVRERRAVGLTSAVAKASAGAVEYVPVARVVNIAQTIEKLKAQSSKLRAQGIWVVGIDMDGETDFTRIDYRTGVAVVIGGEGKGLSPLIKKRCDVLARIPMKGKISSLNASVAAALVMYEVYRQRGWR
jgi:23S rRNA (guanosine2251-2'-O)-methyltransferase